MSVEIRMTEAVHKACAGSVPPETLALIVHAVTSVATTDNGKLLDILKAKNAEIGALQSQLERVLDTSKEGGWMARALDAEREMAVARKEESAHSEWRKRANYRVRELEQQLADAAASGLTKREHFAASMLQGLLSCGLPPTTIAATAAESAVALADALLAALEVKP